ncbi:hypothetical protein GCM10011321_14380 [Youhaiella tibetensis]|uniref:Uncharacterized protein n=1 Tax=Paradevosia tibetensis TaxID=1447062 RepID=A0A5B9DMM1_9HYPH|nr:hypothetical protein [Youhaiella tibetensis]QEE20437.1 hypothetical protein FNA67_09755 [Youhaiella tibetensis]GGF24156.1 hypothetical protein GCM10011321_14380 [Youhaiella tibetensis]
MNEQIPPDDDEDSPRELRELMARTDLFLRANQIEGMTNDELRNIHRVLHHPKFLDDRWLPLIEREMRRRGMINPS